MTEQTRPASTGNAKEVWWKRKWVIGVASLIVGLSIGSSGSSDPKESDQYQGLSANYSNAREDVSSLRTSLAETRAEEDALKADLSDAKDAEADAKKEAKAAQALLAKSAAPTPKPKTKTPVAKTHACTQTASGSCIQGGEFCRQALYGQSGWDGSGRRYTCTGDHVHPHWE
jgi:peptidoglycan hydrolase CwlO-like protein